MRKRERMRERENGSENAKMVRENAKMIRENACENAKMVRENIRETIYDISLIIINIALITKNMI